MKKFIISFFCFFIFSNLFLGSSYAQDFMGSVSAATGGTGVGAVEATDSVLINPATIAQIPTKYFSVGYAEKRWGATVSDNGKEALFPAALGYYRYSWDQLKREDISVGFAYSVSKPFAIGANVIFLKYDDLTKTNQETHRQTVGDFGATYALNSNFAFGMLLKNFFSTTTDLSSALRRQQTSSLGMSYTFDNLSRFRFDIESNSNNKTDRLVFKYGVESFLNDWLVLRLGYQNNNAQSKNFKTAGIGFVGPQFSFHYAYLADVDESSNNRHSVDLGVPF